MFPEMLCKQRLKHIGVTIHLIGWLMSVCQFYCHFCNKKLCRHGKIGTQSQHIWWDETSAMTSQFGAMHVCGNSVSLVEMLRIEMKQVGKN